MGAFGEFLKKTGTGIADAASGGLASGISGAVGGLLGGIGRKKREKRQLENQIKLNEAAAKTNYEYGEKSAENAYKRQMEMYERSYKDQSYAAMRGQMEDAGLSVGLMYGGSGSGGGAGAMSGAAQGATGGAQAGAADSPAAQAAAENQRAELGLNMVMQRKDIELKDAQINQVNATAEKERAQAASLTEDKITTVQSRDALVEKLKQEGMETWIRNVKEQWKAYAGKDWGNEEGTVTKYGQKNEVYGHYGIADNSYVNEEQATTIAKTVAETQAGTAAAAAANALADLNSKKANGYWQELLNATTTANANAVNAAAKKLATEWQTGEYTNWKTWVDVANQVVEAATGVTRAGAVVKAAGK